MKACVAIPRVFSYAYFHLASDANAHSDDVYCSDCALKVLLSLTSQPSVKTAPRRSSSCSGELIVNEALEISDIRYPI